MPAIKPTLHNPYALSIKQRLVIEDMVADIEHNKGINPTKSTQKFYNVKNKEVASEIARQNLGKLGFREALLSYLKKKGIIGENSKVEQRLVEGLDAVIVGSQSSRPSFVPDFMTRLRYIQEIHRVIGL